MSTQQHWFYKQVRWFEESRFAAMTIFLTAQSCLGSVAAMFLLQNDNYVMLAICAGLTMASNSAFIAQVPASWCLTFFYGSVSVNLLLILLNFSL